MIIAEQEARQIILQCEVRISVLSVMLRNAIYSGACRNPTTAAHMHDHEVEMESDPERRRSLTRVRLRVIPGSSNDERLTNVGVTSFLPTQSASHRCCL